MRLSTKGRYAVMAMADLARNGADRAVSLAEIAWLLGFSDQSAFTRAFKRWMGVTPGAWRGGLGAVQ